MNLHVSLNELKNQFVFIRHDASLNAIVNVRKRLNVKIYRGGVFSKNLYRGGGFGMRTFTEDRGNIIG